MNVNIQPWLPLTYRLAIYLEKNDIHKQHLTITERKHFEDAIVSYPVWIAFISINHEELETTVFRVRSMLYEQWIPQLFHSKKPCCSSLPWDQLLSEARNLTMPSQTEISNAWKEYVDNLVKKETDEKPETTEEQTQGSNLKLEESSINLDNVPLRDVYHSLEFDTAAMIEQRKLEDFEAQEALHEAEEAKENATAKSLSMFNADGNFNLKYLLQGIVANRQKTSLSDRELQNLLSDFKPHRSKWANDDRVGQEELYEACEKVLTDLKNYTEHSTPFLNKVNKREAPDYFDIIKKPMDLGTVTKKMKNLVYKSKKEFADDLFLIYDNCLTYNTNPTSEYRKHAIAMRKKTERLLSRVPHISIKEIKTEVEEEGDDMSEDDDNDQLSGKTSGKHMVTQKIPSGDRPSRERSLTRGSSAAPLLDNEDTIGTPDVDTPQGQYGGKHVKSDGDHLDLEQEDKKLGEEIDADMGEFQDQVWRDKTKKTRAKLTTDVEKQYQFEFGEREALVRSSLDMERFSMIEHLHNKPESVIKLVRCDFDSFLKWTDRRLPTATLYDDFDLDSSDDENLDAFFSRKINKPNKVADDSTRNDLFLADYEVVNGLPEIHGVPQDIYENNKSHEHAVVRKSSVDFSPEAFMASLGYSNLSFDIYPELKFPDHGLAPLMDRNINTLEQIRLMYSKCNAIKNNVTMSSLASSIELNSPFIEDLQPTQQQQLVQFTSKPPLVLNNESSYQLSQKVLLKLLTHAGFEGAKTGALNILTDVMVDYISNIGKTLRSYWDNYSHDMSSEEIVSHVLYENGVSDISELEEYAHDIERNVQRLDDLNRRLQTSYQDLLSSPVEKVVDEEQLLQEEDTFTTGIFGEDIGEDYFGFRNLGLDQEYNLDSLQIPSRLWFGKDKDKLPIISDIQKETKYKYPPPPSFVPVTAEKSLIGLLQPYFAKRLSDPNGLVEDEYTNRHKTRPRYPPTNKPTQGRKKLSKETLSITADHKKYKRKRPTEEIVAEKAEKAERKRLKLEEKAQRLAEKEQKRKLREELKEQEKQARMEAKEKKKLLNKKSKHSKTDADDDEE